MMQITVQNNVILDLLLRVQLWKEMLKNISRYQLADFARLNRPSAEVMPRPKDIDMNAAQKQWSVLFVYFKSVTTIPGEHLSTLTKTME